MLHHKGIKSVLIALCLILLTTGGLFTIVGSGGGGDSRDPLGAFRFGNNVICGGRGFTVNYNLGGQSWNAFTGQWSACGTRAPGTYRVDIAFVACGRGYRGFVNMAVQDMCTTNARLRYGGGRFYVEQPRSCPGVCPSGTGEGAEVAKSSGMILNEVVFDGPVEGLELFEDEGPALFGD